MENFNNYLAENKKEARDAIKKAENQTRKKNEKMAFIKDKLEVQADLTGKNMSKKETLQNLKKSCAIFWRWLGDSNWLLRFIYCDLFGVIRLQFSRLK